MTKTGLKEDLAPGLQEGADKITVLLARQRPVGRHWYWEDNQQCSSREVTQYLQILFTLSLEGEQFNHEVKCNNAPEAISAYLVHNKQQQLLSSFIKSLIKALFSLRDCVISCLQILVIGKSVFLVCLMRQNCITLRKLSARILIIF